MAIDHLTANYHRWNAALADFDAAQVAAAAIEAHPPCSIRDNVVALPPKAVDPIYRVPAPTLGAVRRKLELLWATELWDETYSTAFKRTVVGDLVRLEMLMAGVDPTDASGGMDLDKVAADFADAASEYDHYVELHREGLAEAWGTSSLSDTTVLMSEAEAKLLSLSASHLGAVEKKLTILFGDDRFYETDDTAAHTLILRDLRRFIAKQHQ